MFGIMERSRLSMYESTLRQATMDADPVFTPMATMMAVALLGRASNGAISLQPTLRAMVDAIPSGALQRIDGILVANTTPPKSSSEMPIYQMQAIVGGLVYARIIEVVRPQLYGRADNFRRTALSFAEPHYSTGLAMNFSSRPSRAGGWRDSVSDASRAVGVSINDDDDNRKFCVNAVFAIVSEVVARSSNGSTGRDYATTWSSGFLGVVLASHLARVSGEPFELMASQSISRLCLYRVGPTKFERLHSTVISTYNTMAKAGEVVPDVGSNFAGWLKQHDDEGFEVLVEAFDYIVGLARSSNIPDLSAA